MNFTQRLKRYLVGIFIGVLLSFFLFGNRNCNSWLPGERVRYMINEQPLRFTDEVRCLVNCYGLPAGYVSTIALEGKPNYRKSEQREAPQRYLMEGGPGGKSSAMVELRDTASLVISLSIPDAPPCDC